jgi:orotate phosphoribosyltransferase
MHGRRGHFLYESGHHGELWFDLETLCGRPDDLRPAIRELADRIAAYTPEIVCGPLVEGAFVALMVAEQLECTFTYANRFAPQMSQELFAVEYRLPDVQRPLVRGKRVAIINDVINAGSAVRGAYGDLVKHGAEVVAVGSLLTLGDSFAGFAGECGLATESLAHMPNNVWRPEECPLCKTGVTLEQLANS